MSRIGIAVAAGCLALAACRKQGGEAGGQRPQGGTQEVTGTVARADETRLVIRAPDRPDVTLRVSDRTTVKVDGQPASIDRLEEGTSVRASFQTGHGGRPTAITVEAQSPLEKGGTTGGAHARTESGAHGGTGSSPAGDGPNMGPNAPFAGPKRGK
ncbi:hypothetical protein [Anaeromyxobacter oryzae]|uniref:DUF5666 domain-containing protein n=1 Tax=Anaeromyxobacter oryzae TaxID=2918170 RepID=A0ABM7WVZ9_9BACT|nr:hypothetical protein [Anaeromyxobacter oryzae]BDG03677.1 hypothetical protein AMOR_26730 [Anaeromyxobacter oryzae]